MKEQIKKKKIVFVGMSGGVDSSASAALLQKQGYEVIGVFIRTWHPDFLECNEEEERHDAMRVAAHLNIPFLTFDFTDVYKREVADYMISEYKAGRTPNPDVMCNKEVKFGAFFKKAISMGVDYVATGHYAQVFSCNKNSKNFPAFTLAGKRTGDPRLPEFLNFCLKKGIDPSKDQSYFLWTLKQKQLSKIIFPVGNLEKSEVRKLAKKFKLPVAEKKDSQGICFLGAVDLKDFLKHYIKEKKGKVINEKGDEIGWHNGAVFHTLGERHGFTITKKNSTDGPYYVVGKDIKKNILYVSQDRSYLQKGTDFSCCKNLPCSRQSRSQVPFKDNFCLVMKDTNWISEIPKESKNYTCQIRYHGEFLPCKLKIKGKTKVEIIFKKPILVASGQSCVVYDKDVCLGGGVVA